MTGLGQTLFPAQSRGGLLVKGESVIGARLIAQDFTGPGYFHPRASAAGKGFEANYSGATNLAASNAALVKQIADRVDVLKAENPNAKGPVPVDLATSSGSGLDPHLSPAAAAFQVEQVAAARMVPAGEVEKLVRLHTEDRQFGFLGEPRVNVLMLNLALDELWPMR